MNTSADHSLQLVPEVHPGTMNGRTKTGLAWVSVGILALLTIALGADTPHLIGWLGFLAIIVGTLVISSNWLSESPGIKNNHIMFGSATRRGMVAWSLGIFMTGFYVVLYFEPTYLSRVIALVDPLKIAISGESAIGSDGSVSQWFLYGFLYTIAVLVMGIRAIIKYRHSRYQVVRTSSVMFFQLGFAFLIPNILLKLNQPYYEWTNIWPLRYYELFPSEATHLANSGTIGMVMLTWGIASILILTPVLTYFFGKRWYCSWVCGCGGLAETLGDPFRQNSSKTLASWKLERWLIYSVLGLILLTTALLWLDHLWGFLGTTAGTFAKGYGFLIGAIFSGVIGTGFYPIFGSRVWCRFGCPMAAILGLIQRFFSRFRITTNGSQCISCGNCSTYCEMGIDVRWYAQRGQDIVRASCVGCGVCSSVCPRGVLQLEMGPKETRKMVV